MAMKLLYIISYKLPIPPDGKKRLSAEVLPIDTLGGDRGTRTPGLGDANAALSQLSYIPIWRKFRIPSAKSQRIPMQAYIILTRAAISVNRILRRPTQAIVSDPALRCFVPMYRDSSMTMQTQGLPLRLASCFWSFVSSFLHLLRRGHPHQVQAAGQDYLRRFD